MFSEVCTLNSGVCSQRRCEHPAHLSSPAALVCPKTRALSCPPLCLFPFAAAARCVFCLEPLGWFQPLSPGHLPCHTQHSWVLHSAQEPAGQDSSQVYCPKSQLLAGLVGWKSLWKSLQLCTVDCFPFQDMCPMESCLSWGSKAVFSQFPAGLGGFQSSWATFSFQLHQNKCYWGQRSYNTKIILWDTRNLTLILLVHSSPCACVLVCPSLPCPAGSPQGSCPKPAWQWPLTRVCSVATPRGTQGTPPEHLKMWF